MQKIPLKIREELNLKRLSKSESELEFKLELSNARAGNTQTLQNNSALFFVSTSTRSWYMLDMI